jgi:magnesium transporter
MGVNGRGGDLGIADEHVVRRVPVVSRHETVEGARRLLASEPFESVEEVVVLDDGRLAGVVPVGRVLQAGPRTPVEEIMDADPPVIRPGAEEEAAAWALTRRGESTIPIVDADGTFQGVVPAHRLLDALLRAHDRDMARLGGYLASTRRARQAAQEDVPRRLLHRLPWLVVGLAGAMASAVLVGAYEEQLDRVVVLAFFLPGVVYMADAVGTQTETVLIRGLAVGISMRTVLRRELLTGALIGLVVGAAFLPFAMLGWGEADVAIAIGLALVASCSIATVVAVALPWLLHRLGRDPAFGSGPVATIIQDLLSIAVYMLIATAIVA